MPGNDDSNFALQWLHSDGSSIAILSNITTGRRQYPVMREAVNDGRFATPTDALVIINDRNDHGLQAVDI